jgi:hypothetical protein
MMCEKFILKGCDCMGHPGICDSVILESVLHGLIVSVCGIQVSQDRVQWQCFLYMTLYFWM